MVKRNDHPVIGHRRKHCRDLYPQAEFIQYTPVRQTRHAVSFTELVKYFLLFHALSFGDRVAAREIKRNKLIDVNSRVATLAN